MKKSLSILIFLSIFSIQYAQEEKYIGLFVYNFTKYFDWPEATKQGDFVIEVIGHKSVYEELKTITAGKTIGSQNVRVVSLSSPDNIGKCQILFIGHWQSRHMQQIYEKIGSEPVLLISEMEGLLDQGSDINFIIRNGKIKFEVSATNIEGKSLKIDPRIKELAHRVVD